MKRKEKLIKSLGVAILALRNDTIFYDWAQQGSCNCGIVAQAVLGKSVADIKSSANDFITYLNSKNLECTWKNAVKSCPITGLSQFTIINELFEAGLDRSDIVHLEYMDNPAILAKSGIKTTETNIITEKVFDRQEIVPHTNPIKRLFGKTQVVDLHKYVEKPVEVPVVNYFKNKENLILYLSAWKTILEEGYVDTNSEDSNIDLENDLLVALAEENYEKAATIRDSLSKIK